MMTTWFFSFHYHAGRADTDFWRDYQKPEAMTDANRERMERWRHAFPSREDFAPIRTQRASLATGLSIWAPMLCGMGLLKKEHGRRVVDLSRHTKEMRENVEHYVDIRNFILPQALTQSESVAYMKCRP